MPVFPEILSRILGSEPIVSLIISALDVTKVLLGVCCYMLFLFQYYREMQVQFCHKYSIVALFRKVHTESSLFPNTTPEAKVALMSLPSGQTQQNFAWLQGITIGAPAPDSYVTPVDTNLCHSLSPQLTNTGTTPDYDHDLHLYELHIT
jgi:hypothetical protein